MSAKQPEIKFSPFEALLIGEKNRVLKRQPMKNTIFVTRLNQKKRTINLRALFGLEKSPTSSKSGDEVFKMPQRVHEFLNNKKHNYESSKTTGNKKEDMSCHEYKEQKMFVKSNDSVKPKYRKSKLKSKKVKFKEKCNRDGSEKVVNKVQNALKNPSSITKYNLNRRNGGMSNGVVKGSEGDMCNASGYGLRGKDSKFTCETEYESLQPKEVISKINQEDLPNFVYKFFMDNNKNIFNNGNQGKNDNSEKFEMPSLIEILGMSKWRKQFNFSDPDILLNELFKQNYYCYGDFEFPKCPEIEVSDFENDENLVDIIYENFPKSIKFESKDASHDFIDALTHANIIEPVREVNAEVNVAEDNLEQGETLKVSCGTQTSHLDLPRSIDLSSCYHLRTLENGYIATADGFVAIQNHLITDEKFGSLFLNNPDGHDKNDLLMASLMKPLLHNTWVRSLKNF